MILTDADAGVGTAHATPEPRLRPLTFDELLVGGVALSAWALALLLFVTGRNQWLNHDAIITRRTLPLAPALALFLVTWQVMTGAMMLPTTLPMVRMFARACGGQASPKLAVLTLCGAYAAVWAGFAAAALAGDRALHGLVTRWRWLDERPWLIAGGALIAAGAFQFSDLKERCLRECRHPASFLLRYYRRGLRPAWSLGARHGLFCLGCCWALMLVMFAVGVGNLVWMAALTGVMVIEKTSRQGRRLVPIVGALLLAGGALVMLGLGHGPST